MTSDHPTKWTDARFDAHRMGGFINTTLPDLTRREAQLLERTCGRARSSGAGVLVVRGEDGPGLISVSLDASVPEGWVHDVRGGVPGLQAYLDATAT